MYFFSHTPLIRFVSAFPLSQAYLERSSLHDKPPKRIIKIHFSHGKKLIVHITGSVTEV